MAKLKIVTQTDNIETGKAGVQDNWMDDCGPSTLACAGNYLTGSAWTSKDAVTWAEKVGRHDRDGFGDPTSFSQIIKASKYAGLKARYAKSWDDVLKSLDAGAVIGVNVEQAKNYPPKVKLSVWHRKREKRSPGKPYGHYVCFAKLDNMAQFADPTMSGVGAEKYAVPVTLEDFKQIASSKGDAPHKRCLIFTPIKPVIPNVERPVVAPIPPRGVAMLPQPFDGKAVKQELQLLVEQVDSTPWCAAKKTLWDRVNDLKKKLRGDRNV